MTSINFKSRPEAAVAVLRRELCGQRTSRDILPEPQQKAKVIPASGTRRRSQTKNGMLLYFALKGVEVGKEGAKLVVGEGIAGGGHHAASVDDGLGDKAVVGGESAGEILALEQAFEARAFGAAGGVGVVAGGAALIVDLASGGLLGVEAELGVGHFGFVGAAAGEGAYDKRKREKGERAVKLARRACGMMGRARRGDGVFAHHHGQHGRREVGGAGRSV